MDVHHCVSFLLVAGDKVLLETRSKNKASDPGIIAIPGGHMESDETQLQTLTREIKEELGVDAVTSHYLCSLYHPTSELQLLHYYIVPNWQGTIESYEAEKVDWYPIDNAPVAVVADQLALKEYQRLAYLFDN